MAYTTRALIVAKIPSLVLNDALDDNGDGREDTGAMDNVITVASTEVDGYLAGIFSVPFADPAPAKVATAAFVFACYTIYQRRSTPDKDNPFADQNKFWREHLQKVGKGEIPLDAAIEKSFAPGAAITEPISLNTQST